MADTAPLPDSACPGISVIIPAYNYAHYLPEAMDSVLRQDYPHFELIVVDDGSTDNTPAVVAAYGERVRYVHQKNAGLSAARNTGIRAARYDHICFLDADDILLPRLLRRAMETFATLPATYGVIASRCRHIDQDGNPIPTRLLAYPQSTKITTRDIILKTRFCPTGVVARRTVFTESGFFDETLRSSEDRDMWIRISAHHSIYLLSEPLVSYRRHTNSMSRNSVRMKQNMRRVIGKARQARHVPPSAATFWLQVESFLYYQTAWMFFDERQRGKALREIALSFLLWPWFPHPRDLNERPLFRLRSLLYFLRDQPD